MATAFKQVNLQETKSYSNATNGSKEMIKDKNPNKRKSSLQEIFLGQQKKTLSS